MVSSPDVTWRTLSTRAANWLVSARRRTRLTLLSGRRLHQSTSCAGLVLGAMVSQDGTASVLRWDASTWAATSIFTVAALIFPHHECEIAQAVASQGDQMVRYWMHNNMITINGQKMGKSLGNFITLEQFFTGNHDSLEQAYSPMTIRFFILSAHYRSTVDFSNDALKASQKGLERLMNGLNDLERVPVAKQSDEQVKKFVSELRQRCYDAMNDDSRLAT